MPQDMVASLIIAVLTLCFISAAEAVVIVALINRLLMKANLPIIELPRPVPPPEEPEKPEPKGRKVASIKVPS